MQVTPEQFKEMVEGVYKKKSKYSNIKGDVDGFSFDSQKEKARYGELKMMERAGEIRCLELQPVFELQVNGKKICRYIADFMYIKNGNHIVEDVKSEATRKKASYRIKFKLMAAMGIEITET